MNAINRRLDTLLSSNRVLVMAHRGMAGANIVDNTVESYEVALRGGADMLEMDVCASTDGELFVMHDGTEQMMFGIDRNVTTMTAAEIRRLRYMNKNRTPIEHGPHSFDEVLDYLKGRCILNLDRCWDHWEQVLPMVSRHGMEEQILLKSPVQEKYLDFLAAQDVKYMYMPFINEPDELDKVRARDINMVAVQIDSYNEGDAAMEPDFLRALEKEGLCRAICAMTLCYPLGADVIESMIKKWGGEISAERAARFRSRLISGGMRPAGGRDDDRSVLGDPDGGWGWLIERGFNILMTDWPLQMSIYLRENGLKA